MPNENERAEAYAHFLQCFNTAIQNISDFYMHFHIAGAPLPIYRERVYCYELYHQLRLSWGGYSLGGEVDKTHHPLRQGPNLNRAKPDLLVHKPDDMDGNLVVIEVKPVVAKKTGIEKDLRTLTAFLHSGRYYKAVYLAYGGDQKKFNDFRKKAHSLLIRDADHRIDLLSIALYWHCQPRYSAEGVDWGMY
jgi:hypothetical protein